MKLKYFLLGLLSASLLSSAYAITLSGKNTQANLQVLQMGIQAISREEAIVAVPSGTITTAYQLTAGMSQILTVASAGDAVKLPSTTLTPVDTGPKPGLVMTVINGHATNAVNMFPFAATDTITNNGATGAGGAALSIPALKTAECFNGADGKWYCQIG